MTKNPVVHFEMPYKNAKRVSRFYEQAFGWKMNNIGPNMGNYVVAQTTKTDDNNMVQTPGNINGGFFQYDPKNLKLQYPSVVIAVDDLNIAIEEVKKAGGKILGASKNNEPDDIPGIGLYISIEDTEGNRVGLLQPKGM